MEQPLSDLFWLGGIIDGEGCITIQIARPGKNRSSSFPRFTPIIEIVNTNHYIVREAFRILSEVGLSPYLYARMGNLRHKPSMVVMIRGYQRVAKAIGVLLPYIRAKRRQARLILELYANRQGRPKSAYTETDVQLVEAIKTLNRKGP